MINANLAALISSGLTTLLSKNIDNGEVIDSQTQGCTQGWNKPKSKSKGRPGTWAYVEKEALADLDRSNALSDEEMEEIYAAARARGYEL